MLLDGLKEMMRICLKLILFDAVFLLGALLLAEEFMAAGRLSIWILVLLFCGLFLVFLTIKGMMKEFHVTFRYILAPLCLAGMFVGAVFSYYVCFYQRVQYDFVGLFCMMGMLCFFQWWSHKQFLILPSVLEKMYPHLREEAPEAFRTDFCRVAEVGFAKALSKELDLVPEEEITPELQEAVSRWYAVYVGFALIEEAMVLWVLVAGIFGLR